MQQHSVVNLSENQEPSRNQGGPRTESSGENPPEDNSDLSEGSRLVETISMRTLYPHPQESSQESSSEANADFVEESSSESNAILLSPYHHQSTQLRPSMNSRIAQPAVIVEDNEESDSSEDDTIPVQKSPRIPVEWETEIKNTDIEEEMFSNFGVLGLYLLSGLKEISIIEISSSSDELILDFIQIYLLKTRSAKNKMDSTSLDYIRQIESILPSPSSLHKFLKLCKKTRKGENLLIQNCLLYKISIDIHETYGKLCGSPLYKFYLKEVVPLALEFYSTIDWNSLQINLEFIKRITSGVIYKSGLLMQPTKADYVKYYQNEELTYSNLSDGYNLDMYYMQMLYLKMNKINN